MKEEYAKFLDELIEERKKVFSYTDVSRQTVVQYQCDTFTQKFVDRFPHLRRQSGFVGSTEHWWCIDEDDSIVDPTAEQFRTYPILTYEEFDPLKHEVYLGKCPNCGDSRYGLVGQENQFRGFCDDECHEDYAKYCDRERGKLLLNMEDE